MAAVEGAMAGKKRSFDQVGSGVDTAGAMSSSAGPAAKKLHEIVPAENPLNGRPLTRKYFELREVRKQLPVW